MAEPIVALGASLLAADDVRGAVLQEVHAAALCQLKAVSAAWCTHARRELCSRLCRYEGAGITDVDVECLNEAGRPWEVVIAGRHLPHLARLRGFGFVVDVQRVREARLDTNDGPLGGVALRSCIEGEGDPPHELLLAAVACAASEMVRGVPVEWLRQVGATGTLDLRSSGLGVIGAELIGLMLPAARFVDSLRCPSAITCYPVTPQPRSLPNYAFLVYATPFLSASIHTPLLPLAAWMATSSAASRMMMMAISRVPTPPWASPSCARG